MNKQKRKLLFFFCLVFLIFLGCNRTTVSITPGQVAATSLPVLTSTSSPFPLPSPSQTIHPSPSITPTLIPSLHPTTTYTPSPTYTPTFDAVHASTATPAPAAQCPQENPGLVPNFVIPVPTNIIYDIPESKDAILGFLNAGGRLDALVQYLVQNYGGYYQNHPDYGTNIYGMDFTNDGVPDLLVNDGNVRIYSCREAEYAVIFEIPYKTFEHYQIESIQDMNKDGSPDILLENWDDVAIGGDLAYQILGLRGQQIESFLGENNAPCFINYAYSGPCIEDGWIRVFWSGSVEIDDIDQNGTRELIIHDGVGYNFDSQFNGPWRTKTTVFMWNGKWFSPFTYYLEPPIYRFQAVQDADFAVLQGNFDEAFDLYQQGILNDTLEWWTKARQTYDLDIAYSHYTDLPTSTPPAPDPDEYGHLAAYAYYRMMILQVMLGDFDTAQATFDFLQENFPTGIAGNIYTELANAFWTEYQASFNLSLACNRAITFTTGHEEEVLFYIGSYIHGYQSLRYEPQDVCPFK